MIFFGFVLGWGCCTLFFTFLFAKWPGLLSAHEREDTSATGERMA